MECLPGSVSRCRGQSLQPGQMYQQLEQSKVELLPEAQSSIVEDIQTLAVVEKAAIDSVVCRCTDYFVGNEYS